jgi:hypothetical protein
MDAPVRERGGGERNYFRFAPFFFAAFFLPFLAMISLLEVPDDSGVEGGHRIGALTATSPIAFGTRSRALSRDLGFFLSKRARAEP